MPQIRNNKTARAWVGGALLLGAAAVLSGCHVDMWVQPKIKPYYESDFFGDRQAIRPLVNHSVPVGPVRAEDPAYFTGYTNGKPVRTIPRRAVTAYVSPKEMLMRGQDRYNAFCSPCHGRTGNGNGFIMNRGLGYWQKLAASYHTDRLRREPDGYLYDVLVNGHGVMYGYAYRIPNIDERWAVIAYIRTLQLAQTAAPGGAPATGGNAAPNTTNALSEVPGLNADPNAPTQPTNLVGPNGVERPINRTPGGTAESRPNTPESTPGEKTTP